MKIYIVFISLIVAVCFAQVGSEYNYLGTGALVYTSDNTTSQEVVFPVAPIVVSDDFLGGNVAFTADSSEVVTFWAKRTVSGAGSPATVAKYADGTNGYVSCALTSAEEVQEAALYFDDQRTFAIGQGLVFEARVRLAVLPTATSEIFVGFWGDTASGGSNYRVNFHWTASGLIYCEMDDNSTDSDVTSGVTVVANQWVILTIDATDDDDVKFYINGNRVCSSTTFDYAAATTNVQPYMGCYKPANAGLGTLNVDYVRIFSNRM